MKTKTKLIKTRELIANIITNDCVGETCPKGDDGEGISCEYCRADKVISELRKSWVRIPDEINTDLGTNIGVWIDQGT